MVPIVYPPGLPVPQTSTVTPAERRALSDAQRPREARALQRDRLEFERITWPPMNATQCATLLAWWRTTLVYGGAWFAATWPLPRGFVVAVRKLREQPRWEYVAGGYWRLSALCEVRGRGVLPQDMSDPCWQYVVLYMPTEDPDLSYTLTELTGKSPGFHSVSSLSWATSDAWNSTVSADIGNSSLWFEAYDTPHMGRPPFGNNMVAVADPTGTLYGFPGDFTIELSYQDTQGFGIPVHRNIISLTLFNTEVPTANIWDFYIHTNDFYFSANGFPGAMLISQSARIDGILLNKFAITREGDVFRGYMNGVKGGEVTVAGANLTNPGFRNLAIAGPYLTGSPLPNQFAAGYYDQIRITNGVARYTGNTYTVSNRPFPNH